MGRVLQIARTGTTALALHPLRSLVTGAALVVVLVPYLVGVGLARGLEDDAGAAVEFGADLYVTGARFGRMAPLPVAAADEVRRLPGVVSVIPRIVGRIELGRERISAVVVGVPLEGLPPTLECIEGRLFQGGVRNELVVGSELARRLNLKVGALIPPFYHNRAGERVSEVVGIFHADVAFWQARLVVTSLETAGHLFDQKDRATDLLVHCRPGYEDAVRRAIHQQVIISTDDGPLPLRITTRTDLGELLAADVAQREGAFTVLFVLGFAVGILVILVTSGFGLSERRREIGILKAFGWQTDELILRSLTESLLISVAAASASVLAALAWLRWLGGYGITGVFLPGVEASPGFVPPFRLTPTPVLLAFLIAFVVVMSGSIYSTWRAATAPPREAMR
jgi:ABC-type lipoprotein release transport system permease subunit